MMNVVTAATVTVATSPVTLYSFTPGKNGGIFWKYIADNLGLTDRSGEIACSWDVTDNITKYFDTSTLDNVDYLTAPGACTPADAGTGSTNTDGVHKIKVTFYTAAGETELGTEATVTVTGNDDISITALPVSTDPACVGRYIYMTEAAGSTYYRTTDVANNTATTATIAVDDTALALLTAAPSSNTSALPDSSYLTFATSMSGGVVSLTATSTSGDWTVMTSEIARLIKNS